ncbi:MAG TPA: hypothetical protein VGP82_25670 [Ktedonobacterales bacterium]|nr:hypothetical protein [Ktedonobacterales bacterium]
MDECGRQLRVYNWLRRSARRTASVLTLGWRTNEHYAFACTLGAVTSLLVVAYYVNHPSPEQYPDYPDAAEYLGRAHDIQMQGQIVDPRRLPGFPLLIVLVFKLTGQGNVMAVSITNALLFVVASLEIYVIAVLVLQRRWAALLIGILVGTNVVLLSFVKPILSEALALWLVVSLTLATVLFVRTLQVRYLWIAMACILLLCLTRGEWVALPGLLYAYLIWVAARQGGEIRRPAVHALLAATVLYAVLGSYIFVNATEYHFVGMTDTQNVNLWGKVLQYDMQNEAPAKYAAITRIANTYRHDRGPTPYEMLKRDPVLSSNHFAFAADYARAIIVRHPVEFLVKSVPTALGSLVNFYYQSRVAPQGPLGGPLLAIQFFHRQLFRLNVLFPVIAGAWLLLLFRRRTACLRPVQMMGAIVLIAVYGLVLTTLGGFDAYMRYHTPFNPLLILIIWATVVAGLRYFAMPHAVHSIAHALSAIPYRRASR